MADKGKYSEIFGSTSKYSFLRILLFSISYIFYIVITRLLGPEEFGKLALLILIGTELGTILVVGFPMVLTRFIPEMSSELEKRKLFSRTFNITSIIFLAFAFIYFPAVQFFGAFLPSEVVEARYFLFIFIVVVGFIRLGIGMMSGLGEFIKGTVFDGSVHIIWRLIAFIVIMFFSYRQFGNIFIINVAVHIIATVVIFILLRSYFRKAGLKLGGIVSRFTIIIMASQLIYSVVLMIDPILIRYIMGSSEHVGYYYAGTRIPLLFQALFFVPLTTPFLYFFSKKDTIERIRDNIIKFGSRIMAVVFSIIALFLYTLADKFILSFFGDAYQESIIILKILAFTLFFIALEVFLNPFFLSINKPVVPLVLGVVYLVLLIGLDIVLIPYFDSAGPAIATLIVLFIRTTTYIILLARNSILMIKTYIILFLILGISVAIDIFLLKYSGIFIYTGLIFATRMLTIRDIKRMVLLITKRKLT
jgi:O-antigen/teichoic acid export membrane protein